jgi:uncharacterized membrane protein
VSVLWGLYALALLTGGIWKEARTLRLTGLALCVVVVVKVFRVDLAAMPTIYKAIAFMIVGVLLLLGSFAYLYAQRRFRRE